MVQGQGEERANTKETNCEDHSRQRKEEDLKHSGGELYSDDEEAAYYPHRVRRHSSRDRSSSGERNRRRHSRSPSPPREASSERGGTRRRERSRSRSRRRSPRRRARSPDEEREKHSDDQDSIRRSSDWDKESSTHSRDRYNSPGGSWHGRRRDGGGKSSDGEDSYHHSGRHHGSKVGKGRRFGGYGQTHTYNQERANQGSKYGRGCGTNYGGYANRSFQGSDHKDGEDVVARLQKGLSLLPPPKEPQCGNLDQFNYPAPPSWYLQEVEEWERREEAAEKAVDIKEVGLLGAFEKQQQNMLAGAQASFPSQGGDPRGCDVPATPLSTAAALPGPLTLASHPQNATLFNSPLAGGSETQVELVSVATPNNATLATSHASPPTNPGPNIQLGCLADSAVISADNLTKEKVTNGRKEIEDFVAGFSRQTEEGGEEDMEVCPISPVAATTSSAAVATLSDLMKQENLNAANPARAEAISEETKTEDAASSGDMASKEGMVSEGGVSGGRPIMAKVNAQEQLIKLSEITHLQVYVPPIILEPQATPSSPSKSHISSAPPTQEAMPTQVMESSLPRSTSLTFSPPISALQDAEVVPAQLTNPQPSIVTDTVPEGVSYEDATEKEEPVYSLRSKGKETKRKWGVPTAKKPPPIRPKMPSDGGGINYDDYLDQLVEEEEEKPSSGASESLLSNLPVLVSAPDMDAIPTLDQQLSRDFPLINGSGSDRPEHEREESLQSLVGIKPGQ